MINCRAVDYVTLSILHIIASFTYWFEFCILVIFTGYYKAGGRGFSYPVSMFCHINFNAVYNKNVFNVFIHM